MSTGFTELKRAWLWGWRTPRVLGGWLLLVGALGSLRWLGPFSRVAAPHSRFKPIYANLGRSAMVVSVTSLVSGVKRCVAA